MTHTLYTGRYGQNVGGARGYAGFRNRRRLKLLTALIPVGAQDSVLEIGPNQGLLLDAFKERAGSVVGIDINEAVVQKAARPDLLYMDATHMTFAAESFTTVIGIEVFEHIGPLQQVFSEVERVLVPGGRCYMTVPFELFRGQQALGDAWAVYRDFRAARRLHVHRLNPSRIRKMTAHTTLSVTQARLIWIPGPSYFIVLQKDSISTSTANPH